MGSLLNNKEEYAKARSDFDRDWNARRILNNLAMVNSEFCVTRWHTENRQAGTDKESSAVEGAPARILYELRRILKLPLLGKTSFASSQRLPMQYSA